MSETEGNAARPPRFPYVAAALCAACVGAAAWTWMGYSYAWEMRLDGRPARWDGYYVCLQGQVHKATRGPIRLLGSRRSPQPFIPSPADRVVVGFGLTRNKGDIPVLALREPEAPIPHTGIHGAFLGRVSVLGSAGSPDVVYVDNMRSRFTWQSITGLVVGAVGVFVFAFFLVRWLRRRRAAA